MSSPWDLPGGILAGGLLLILVGLAFAVPVMTESGIGIAGIGALALFLAWITRRTA